MVYGPSADRPVGNPRQGFNWTGAFAFAGMSLYQYCEEPITLPITLSTTWKHFQNISNKWMWQPDFEAVRACLAAVKSLDVETTPVWLMLIGPSGAGKTAYYIRACESYHRYELTDEMSAAGLSSGRSNNWGDGLLKRLGERGLWLMPDFTVFLNMKEERRNEVMGIQRRLFDGKYDRIAAGEKLSWKGRIHVVAACTNALERFTRVNSDLGERFIQVRIERKEPTDGLLIRANMQRQHWQQYQDELQMAAKSHIKSTRPIPPQISFQIERKIMDWADFVSMGRRATFYNYRDEIIGVGQQEGSTRIHQQMTGLAIADAWLMGQDQVSEIQLSLVERIAMDCLPWSRRAILHWFRTDQAIDMAEVRKLSGITHPVTFSKAISELEAIGAVVVEGIGNFAGQRVRLSDGLKSLLL